MIKRTRLVLALSVVLGAALLAGPVPAAQAATDMIPFKVGLDSPSAFTFAPDGRIFYGERFSGEIRILSADGLTDTLFATVPNIYDIQGAGLLGIALHPNYPATPQVYVYATRDFGGTPRNQILRYTDDGAGNGTFDTVIWDASIDAGHRHRGGRILFGPDGMLYALQGDTSIADDAQHLSSTAGKVFRMMPDGSVPADNPIPGSLVWAFGIRNSFGFAFDPVTGDLWESENGPTCNDELNRIPAGRNMGWGRHQDCRTPPRHPINTNQDGPNPVLPKAWYTPTIAPTGLGFCSGCGLPAGEGRLYFADWNHGALHRVRLTADRHAVASERIVLHNDKGLMSLEAAPDGTLWVSDQDGIYELSSV